MMDVLIKAVSLNQQLASLVLKMMEEEMYVFNKLCHAIQVTKTMEEPLKDVFLKLILASQATKMMEGEMSASLEMLLVLLDTKTMVEETSAF